MNSRVKIRVALVSLATGLMVALVACSVPVAVPEPVGTTPAPEPVEIFVLIPKAVTLQVRQIHHFEVTVLDQFENPVPGLYAVLTANKEAGRIDRHGKFTAGNTSGYYEAAVIVEVRQGHVVHRATADVTLTARQLSLLPATAVSAGGISPVP